MENQAFLERIQKEQADAGSAHLLHVEGIGYEMHFPAEEELTIYTASDIGRETGSFAKAILTERPLTELFQGKLHRVGQIMLRFPQDSGMPTLNGRRGHLHLTSDPATCTRDYPTRG